MMSAFLIILVIASVAGTVYLASKNRQRAERSGRKSLRLAALFLIFPLIISQTACSEKNTEQAKISKDGFYLDTYCVVTIYAVEGGMENEDAVLELIDGAFDVCAEYEGLLSRTREGSDIWNINHSNGQPVECSPITIAALEKAIEYCRLSGGLFDITIGRVTDLWDFRDLDEPSVPDSDELEKACETVDYHCIVISDNTVTLKSRADYWLQDGSEEYAWIDLGGMAKGYIADAMTAYLAEHGVTGAVVDLGGNVAILGYKDGVESEFTVGIKEPFSETGEIAETISAANASIVTSGIYERYFEIGGTRYHHILDGKTGYPADRELLSATVIGPEGRSADCDALATIAMLAGEKKAAELMKRKPGFTLIVIREDQSIATY